ncbi:MAG: C39 family peptidase [Candidatus Yanofskybacteria bacterium]|nr:C39 family peptidase [Candidatus Yanofskybacteria bacterium]
MAILILIAVLVLAVWDGEYYANRSGQPTLSPVPPSTGINKLPSISSPTPRISPTPTPARTPVQDKNISLSVPFTSQAPYGDWKDERQQDGCEEASSLMAIRWVRGQSLTRDDALREILAISEYEQLKYGGFHDTSAEDTAERIFREYFKYDGVEVRHDITTVDIRNELDKGNLIVVPVNGQKLGNPFFTQPGPYRHMIVIRGWDANKKEFITNDPGTKHGENYRYQEYAIQNAFMDYATGHEVPVVEGKTAMIIVLPQRP